jgi:hypothetical protein
MSGMMPPLPPGFGPAGPDNEDPGQEEWAKEFSGQIWRLHNGQWECVHTSKIEYGLLPVVSNPMLPPPSPIVGYYPESYGYRTMGVYDGRLFAIGIGTWVPNMPLARILRTSTGEPGAWEPCLSFY